MADFDPYHKWLGIAPDEQPATHYRLLGLREFEDDADVIENAADQRMAHLRSLQMGQHAAASQKLLSEIASARQVLLNPQQREAYNATLKDDAKLEEQPEPVEIEPLPAAEPFDPLAAAAEQPLPYAPPPYSAVQPVQPFAPAPAYNSGSDQGNQTGMIVMAVAAIAGGGVLLLAIVVALAMLGQSEVVSVPPDGVELDGSAIDGVAVDSFAADGLTADGTELDGAALDTSVADGVEFDGAAADGAAFDGNVVDGNPVDGSAFAGNAVVGDGAAPVVPPAVTPSDDDGFSAPATTDLLELPAAVEADMAGETPFAIDFSPDGLTIAIGGSSGAVHFYDVAKQKFTARTQVQQGWTWDVDFAPNNALAVSGGFSSQLYVLNPQRQKVFTTKPHTGKTRVVEYSPDGSRLAMASDDKTATIHDTATGRRLFRLPHSGIAIGADFSADGRTLVTGGGKGHLRFWNVATGRPSSSILNATPGCIWCLACSSQGVVAAGDEQSNLNLHKMDNRRPLHKMNLQSGRVSGIDFTADGKLVACTTEAGGLYVFDVASGKKLQHIPASGQKFTRLKFSPDDRMLAALVASGKLLIYRVADH